MALFKIETVIYLESVNSIFILGDIIEGKLKNGMRVHLIDMILPIGKIEFADGKLYNNLVSKVALKISSVNEELFTSLKKKQLEGVEVMIE